VQIAEKLPVVQDEAQMPNAVPVVVRDNEVMQSESSNEEMAD
jgi:hypothetical protein